MRIHFKWICDIGMKRVVIEINRSGLGKKFIVKVYDDKWLLESCPYDNLDTDLFEYVKQQWEKD